ncbi:hypothetical protein M947_08220 [Sulfurimonas hongkongensis]|uniref:Uncharacterized protein n=1 Tax=Sulfurimonas hongkongensis TaxID=1172190 RepID=T0JM05_9BACT|nr:DUF4105 domain-containing protein [Sulfurimonas hongkongensis]EQB39136.1 hypothetical protein M947_08220 [Sulfurimonas hongkongensis]
MNDGFSEIDDANFFLSKDGKKSAKKELNATITALLNETKFDDNSTACRFPARKAWLKEQLDIKEFPEVRCDEYDSILKRLNPKSATIVFPSAHINSPASMFGHTFLRINSGYKSKLLSYAINYAANANPDTENGVIFAIKGLFGGYYGKYSLLPYYDKLKEYRDTEQRDIWEYDLNLNEEEVLQMVRHIWELNGTHSNYYFFTENCSYNMLWFIEIARPSINLRDHFTYQVIPLETVHAALKEDLIEESSYRASKRTILLKYESIIEVKYIKLPRKLVEKKISLEDIINSSEIEAQQKMYILEAATEFLEYSFSKNDMTKEQYLELFHNITKARATFGKGKKLDIKTPPNPIESHRAIRATTGFGIRDGDGIGFLGIRGAYHSLEDSSYGFLRGTEIEFLDVLLSQTSDKTKLENATIISIASIAQRSEFFDSFSWRTKFGWDNNYINDKSNFFATLGAGFSWGNDLAYTYIMLDPLYYYEQKSVFGVGSSIGVVIDKYKNTNTNFEITQRFYDTSDKQILIKASQSFRVSQNLQLQLSYDYKERYFNDKKENEQTYKASINCYF